MKVQGVSRSFKEFKEFQKYLCLLMVAVALLSACGPSKEEARRLSRAERQRLAREDSAALKVGVLPTMDCLPIFLAKERRLFDTLGVDIRPKAFTAQLDAEEALRKGRIEGCMGDVVRAERLMKRGMQLRYVAATNTYWQFISNRKARVRELRQMTDKMVAMSNHSATDMLAQMCIDSAKLKRDDVFRVPVNDVNIRLLMLKNNEMDAMMLTEPQAAEARLFKNPVLMDTRKKDLLMGAIYFNEKALKGKDRQKQMEAFVKAYNMACDSLNRNGLKPYADIIWKYMKADKEVVEELPKMNFPHAAKPRQKDIDAARRWLGK